MIRIPSLTTSINTQPLNYTWLPNPPPKTYDLQGLMQESLLGANFLCHIYIKCAYISRPGGGLMFEIWVFLSCVLL